MWVRIPPGLLRVRKKESMYAAVLLALLPGAPAPKYKEPPPPTIAPGIYGIYWCGYSPNWVTLHKDGTYEWPYAGTVHRGTWTYLEKTRTLHMHNTGDNGESWSDYAFQMCAQCKEGRHTEQNEATGYKSTYKITIFHRVKPGAELPPLPGSLHQNSP